MRDSISIVIPAYNEESRIAGTLKKVGGYLTNKFKEYEILVVDDGSSDGTASVVKAVSREVAHITLIRYPENSGKGYAIRRGVLSSRYKLLLISDADLSTPIEEFERLEHFVNSGFDIAIGSRGLRDSNIVVRQPWYRETMGKMFNLLVRTLAVAGIKDTQCGFKLFNGDVARSVFRKGRINGFAFDVEILFLAIKAGYRVREVSITWLNSPNSRVDILSDPLKMFLELFKIRAYWLFGKYANSGQIRTDTSQL